MGVIRRGRYSPEHNQNLPQKGWFCPPTECPADILRAKTIDVMPIEMPLSALVAAIQFRNGRAEKQTHSRNEVAPTGRSLVMLSKTSLRANDLRPTPLYQTDADRLILQTSVLDARPGAVLLDQCVVFPGGGGQLPDAATLRWHQGEAPVTGVAPDERGWWHSFEGTDEPEGAVQVSVDAALRSLMRELHTLAHIANSVVFQEFNGALLTGAQLSSDGTFRVDFDLPGSDADRLRALADPINAVVQADLPVRAFFMPWDEADAVPGLFRSKAVSPPRQDDGNVRIVEIGDLDRQGCGGTHLSSTGQARRVRILKVDNKGRQNRRVKIGFAE